MKSLGHNWQHSGFIVSEQEPKSKTSTQSASWAEVGEAIDCTTMLPKSIIHLDEVDSPDDPGVK